MPLVRGADFNGTASAIRPIYSSTAHIGRVRPAYMLHNHSCNACVAASQRFAAQASTGKGERGLNAQTVDVRLKKEYGFNSPIDKIPQI
eukprot:2194556-Pleurochrysis_carterae.AAC.2